MIANLKPYQSYRYSGVPWLMKVPEHWCVKRLKCLARFIYGQSLNTEMRQSGSIPVYGSNGIVGTHVVANTNSPCLIIGRKGSFGKLNYSSTPVFAIDTTFYIDGSSSSNNIKWLFYLLGILHLDKVSKDSAVPGLNRNDAYQSLAPLPPPEEQAAIVRYLDYMDRNIKKYIRAKQKLIKLLEEQKQAIIHQAVTRGLNPDVPMKPSGVEWLEEIPEHWEIKKVKQLGSVRIGLTYSPADVCDESGTLVLRASNIRYASIVSADNVYVSKSIPRNLLVAEGDILICVRSGSKNLVGKSALITSELSGATYGAFMSILRSQHNMFIYWVLNSNMLPCVMAQFETSTINQLTQNDLRNLVIPMPPAKEQICIAEYLVTMTENTNSVITNANHEISLLKEYLNRLIADVVTGKVDIRDIAARLPKMDESDILEEAVLDDEIVDTEDDGLSEEDTDAEE